MTKEKMPTLKQLLQSKTAFIAKEQQALEALIIKLGNQFANDFARIVASGVFDLAILLDALDSLGYSQAVLAQVRLQGKTIQTVLTFSKQVAAAQGLRFALTATNERQLAAFLTAAQEKIAAGFRREIAADLLRFAFEAKLSQKPTEQIIGEVREKFEVIGRRAGTEVNTALTIFDRAVMSDVYENAGIELFYYFPNNTIPTSRESCIAAVNDKRQLTGWTREDIANEEKLDFVRGGYPYYNCRHEWISFAASSAFDEFLAENPPGEPG